MRLLMVGDVVGKPGRNTLVGLLPELRDELQIDVAVVNGENAAAGVGITREIAAALVKNGHADVITLGNHAWSNKDIIPYLDEDTRLLRPLNYPAGAPGRGSGVYQTPAGPLGVLVVQLRTFMTAIDCPFVAARSAAAQLRRSTQAVLVEMHGEATSEKAALGWYLDGEVSAVVGTHTHVQTCDERILPGGTAYITDVGMTGPLNSVIGSKPEQVIARFVTGIPHRFEVADFPCILCGVLIDIDTETGKARSIERIQRTLEEA